ncbi:MAG: hypothetical protein SV422_01705 [Pseudomonadota bacterium]|nr:hypothetical protein [Pseudomonadota bacterium]
MRIPTLMAFACSFVICDAAFAQRAQLSFTGTTSASEMLIRDVMRNVMDLGDEEFDCPMPESVVADVLPAQFQPANPVAAPKGARKQVYERWTIDFCGDTVPFLLTFWTLEQGGTAFDLDYPFEELTTAMEEGGSRLQ